MLIIEDVEVRWSGSNRKHFESLGYVYTIKGDSFIVKSNELTKGSNTKVKVLCDYCKVNFSMKTYKTYIVQQSTDIVFKDCCKPCTKYKTSEGNLKTYGIEWITQTENFKEKSKITHLKNHGVEYYSQTEEFEEKRKATSMERHGVEYAMQSQEKIEMRRKTYLKTFGVDHPMKNDQHKEKVMKAIYEKEGTPCSNQQRHIHALVGGLLNYPCGRCFLDIAFLSEKIYLEYDGGGHDLQVKFRQLTQEEFDKKERKRSYYLARIGWKEIRIIARKDVLPEDFVIVSFTDKAKSFLIGKKAYSILFDADTKKVLINHKNEIGIDEFLNESFDLRKKVS